MHLTRRQLLAGIAAGGASRLAAQGGRGAGAMGMHLTPPVCLYSQVLIEIAYIDLPMVVQGLGFDGVDLTVEPGGHVLPEKAGNFLMPALEAFTGIGLDVPMITTSITALDEPHAQDVLGLASYIKVPFFRPGRWKFSGSPAIEAQLPLVQQKVAGLGQLARVTNMTMGIQNYIEGTEGAAVPDIARVIQPFDPHFVGYDFDVAYATVQGGAAGFAPALQLALPRLKMVSVRDFKWDQPPGAPRAMTPCPLGEGVVDWPPFFAALAKARFSGPISVQVDHNPKSMMSGIRKDLAFVRKQIATVWPPR